MFVYLWEDIEFLAGDELIAILSFLSDKDYACNEGFATNVSKYIRLGLITMNFPTALILRSRYYSVPALKGLLGIYFGMIPDAAQGCTFDYRAIEPWTQKTPATAVVTTVGADAPATTPASLDSSGTINL